MEILAKNMDSFDDLVFENRNQSYGAYAMRKRYNNAMAKAFSFSTLFLVLLLFVATRKPPVPHTIIKPPVPPTKIVEDLTPPEKVETEKKELAKSDPNPPATRLVPEYSATGVDRPEIKIDPNAAIGTENRTGEIKPLDPDDVYEPGEDSIGNGKPAKIEPPRHIAEVMPAYPGGEPAMMKFIAAQAHKNNQWSDMGLTGTIYVQFVVGADGTVRNVEAVSGNYDLLKKVAVNSIKNMPNWSPGKQDGHAVSVILTVPISFKTN